jgi:hypothetical protein
MAGHQSRAPRSHCGAPLRVGLFLHSATLNETLYGLGRPASRYSPNLDRVAGRSSSLAAGLQAQVPSVAMAPALNRLVFVEARLNGVSEPSHDRSEDFFLSRAPKRTRPDPTSRSVAGSGTAGGGGCERSVVPGIPGVKTGTYPLPAGTPEPEDGALDNITGGTAYGSGGTRLAGSSAISWLAIGACLD